LVTPNAREAATFAATSGRGVTGAIASARILLDRWPVAAVAVTTGSLGAVLLDGSGSPFACPAEPLTGPLDVSGAGDAFAIGAAAALAGRALPTEAVQAAIASASGYLRAAASHGIGWVTSTDGSPLAVPIPGSGPGAGALGGAPITVATSGCFDLVHRGHVAFLEQARRLGDRLVVLLNGDASVCRLKGAGRPIQAVEDRRAVLEAMLAVDAVEVFDEDTPVDALRRLRPVIFAKGGDYTVADLPETAVLAEWGGTTVTLPYLSGRSTTRLIEEVRHRVHVQP
jgi:rfaE bifunctional protein nucleotidyltransferase chain/domain